MIEMKTYYSNQVNNSPSAEKEPSLFQALQTKVSNLKEKIFRTQEKAQARADKREARLWTAKQAGLSPEETSVYLRDPSFLRDRVCRRILERDDTSSPASVIIDPVPNENR